MKRIEFIAPVEAMRGNLSGTQKDLVYPTNDNSAYESPVGSRNYARNYQPIFVGAKRASDNLKYFAVRTKTAIGMTTLAKRTMALLGGCGAIVAAILRDKTATLYTDLLAAYEYAKSKGGAHTKSFREYLTWQIKGNLQAKNPACFIGAKDNLTIVAVNNPWHSTGYGPSALTVDVNAESLAKFWMELADSPVLFHVGNYTGVAHANDSFANIIASRYNVLALSAELGTNNVMKSGMYVVYEDADEIFQVQKTFAIDTAVDYQYQMQTTPGRDQG